MKTTTSKKKIVLATLLTSGLAMAVSQSALSQPAQPAPSDTKETQMMSPGRNQMDPAMLKLHEKFLNETVVIRKEMVQKNAVMRALLDADIPDATKVSQVAGELFDLREKLRVKANEIGMPMMGMGMGMGMGDGDEMPCQGMGMGGRHRKM
jgi:zinc resistance-associated protein